MPEEPNEQTVTPDELNFARELKRLREDANMTQAELVRQMHARGLDYLNQTALSRIENGTRQARLIEAKVIAEVFDRRLESMLVPDALLDAAKALDANLRAANQVMERFTSSLVDIEQITEHVEFAKVDLDGEIATRKKVDFAIEYLSVRAGRFLRDAPEILRNNERWLEADGEY